MPDNLPKFEDAIDQVETIIAQIESGDVDLEQCLTQYETGVKLIKHCESILRNAEAKIAALKMDESGNLVVEGEADAGDDDADEF